MLESSLKTTLFSGQGEIHSRFGFCNTLRSRIFQQRIGKTFHTHCRISAAPPCAFYDATHTRHIRMYNPYTKGNMFCFPTRLKVSLPTFLKCCLIFRPIKTVHGVCCLWLEPQLYLHK